MVGTKFLYKTLGFWIFFSISTSSYASNYLCEVMGDTIEDIYLSHQRGQDKLEFYNKLINDLGWHRDDELSSLLMDFYLQVASESYNLPKIQGYASRRQAASNFSAQKVSECKSQIAPLMAEAAHHDQSRYIQGNVVESIKVYESDSHKIIYRVQCKSGLSKLVWAYDDGKISWTLPNGHSSNFKFGISVQQAAVNSCS